MEEIGKSLSQDVCSVNRCVGNGKNMLVVGLTGSFGTGKTTVALMFARLGAKVIDADKIAHRLMRPKGACVQSIIKAFGKKIVSRGQIDRKALAQIVFNSPEKLKRLCQIIHPPVIRETKKEIAAYKKRKKRGVIVIDAPLLIEAGLDRQADILVVVGASREKQVERIKRRMNISQSQIIKRINMQLSIREKQRRADIVIDNRGSIKATRKQVDDIWKKLQRMQKNKP